jgi:hypothetical protein
MNGMALRTVPRGLQGERSMNEKDGRIVVTAVEARGARLGRPVLVVLIVSTLAVIGIFSLLYYGSFG